MRFCSVELTFAQDMAGAVAFLLSQDSAMMTGETIVISGGVSTRL